MQCDPQRMKSRYDRPFVAPLRPLGIRSSTKGQALRMNTGEARGHTICVDQIIPTLTVSTVVVLAALLDPGRKLTCFLTAHHSGMIIDEVPRWVAAPKRGEPVITKLRLSLNESRIYINLCAW